MAPGARRPSVRFSPPPLPPRIEARRQFLLEPAVHGPVVDAAAQGVGEGLLVYARLCRVMGVLITLAIALVGHESGRGIAEMERHGLGGPVPKFHVDRISRGGDAGGLRRD